MFSRFPVNSDWKICPFSGFPVNNAWEVLIFKGLTVNGFGDVFYLMERMENFSGGVSVFWWGRCSNFVAPAVHLLVCTLNLLVCARILADLPSGKFGDTSGPLSGSFPLNLGAGVF